MEIVLKRTLPSDPAFTGLAALLDEELWERNPGRQTEYVSHNILAPETRCMVALYDGEPVAIGAFRNLGGNTAEIKRMYVRKENRGQGISRFVLSGLESWAKEEGCTKAILETGFTHPEAISLYKKSGYQIIENYGPYKNLPNSVCMAKQL